MTSAALVSLLVVMTVQAGEANLEEHFVRMQTSSSTEFSSPSVGNDGRKGDNNHVEYYIDNSYSNEEKNAIRSAITYITDQLVEGCLTFEELDEQPFQGKNFMWFQNRGPCTQTQTGRRNGRISSRAACMERGRVVHEILHALGAGLEHNRVDRDTFIDVNLSNVAPLDRKNYEKNVNFDTHKTPYDFFSIMHYGRYDGAIDKNIPVIKFKTHLQQNPDASNKAIMTPTDIVDLSRQYQCGIREEIQIQHLSYTTDVFKMMIVDINGHLDSKDKLNECGDKLKVAETILEELELLNCTTVEVYRSQYYYLKGRYSSLRDTTQLQNEVLTLKSQNQDLQKEIRMIQMQNQELQSNMAVWKRTSDAQRMQAVHCAYSERTDGRSSAKTIIYGSSHTEVNSAGSSMGTSTGKYTAGKSGVYQVSASARYGFTSGTSDLYVYLRTSSGRYQGSEACLAFMRGIGTSKLYTPLNAIRYLHMEKGETIHLEYQCSYNCGIDKLKFCVSLYN